MKIQRYTKSNWGRLSKCDGGELVYYINHNEVLTEKTNYYLKAIKDYQDIMVSLVLRNKKHNIVMWLSLLVNVGLLIWLMN